MKKLKIRVVKSLAISSLLITFGCSSLPNATDMPQATSKRYATDEIFDGSDEGNFFNSNSAASNYLRQGIVHLKADELEEASRQFNLALSFDPGNAYYHFFNGLAYHLLAETSDPSQLKSAKLAYAQSLKFDPNIYLASAQLGRIYLKERAYNKAQNSFAHALLFNPDNADLLYALAKASYMAKDLVTARDAIEKAKEIDDGTPEIVGAYSIIKAATGDFSDARENLQMIDAVMFKPARMQAISQRITDWEQLYSELDEESEDEESSEEPSKNSDAPFIDTLVVKNAVADASADERLDEKSGVQESTDPQMVILDIVMIRTEEFDTTNKGFNLLEGLNIQLDADRVLTRPTEDDDSFATFSNVFSNTLTLPKINYNLNIFNAGDDRNEIIARPSLIALDGKESTFFSGSNVNVALEGDDYATLSNIKIGIELKVTPIFLETGSIQFKINVSRGFFEVGAAGTFDQSIRTSENEVTANVVMDFDQTLILSGLREKQTSEIKSGVPLLRDIPLLQYAFSNEITQDFHKSVLVMVTPHRVNEEYNASAHVAEGINTKELQKFKRRFGKNINLTNNLVHVIDHIKKHGSYREVRERDIFDKNWWGSKESIDDVVNRALSFLYY